MPTDILIQDHYSTQTGQASIIAESVWQEWIQIWLEHLQPQIIHPQISKQILAATGYELSLRLTDDSEIQIFNADYRQINRPTDVLAFAALEVEFNPEWADGLPLTPPMEDEPLYLGDIVISVETAYRQAIEQGHPRRTELAWLCAHGVLHLLGWDHPDPEQLQQMLNQQVRLLNLAGIYDFSEKYVKE
jgi:probable rRNA maturation factor